MNTSKSATDCVSAVLSGKREVSPEYVSARANVKPIELHCPTDSTGMLYSVTTIAGSQACGGSRTVAVCDSFAIANQMVTENWGDLYECSYGLLVVEQLRVNDLYGGMGREQYWYAWQGDSRTGCYVPIETPDEFAAIQCWGIG